MVSTLNSRDREVHVRASGKLSCAFWVVHFTPSPQSVNLFTQEYGRAKANCYEK